MKSSDSMRAKALKNKAESVSKVRLHQKGLELFQFGAQISIYRTN